MDTKEIEERQIIPIVEMNSEKYLEGIGKNNYSGSQEELHPIGENNKDIINTIKNKNNYNKESQIKKSNKANFEQRDYTGFDFTKLYANVDAFYKYMIENGFEMQRGLPKEETNRQHYSVEEYKKITNFKQTKEV